VALRIERSPNADFLALGPEGTARRLRSLVPGGESVQEVVAEIVSRVRDQGDSAILDYTRRLDTAGVEPPPLLVSEAELDAAIKKIPLDVVAGLQVAIRNVAETAQAGLGVDEQLTLAQGQRIVIRELPVRAAAVYVPGGRAPYPSTVVMGVVTARSAGVLDVCVCAPPDRSGDVNPLILGTCRLLGVQTVYRMGGAQAVAALAYGSETVGRVDVVVGPGNLYVQEAKRQLSGVVGIDGFAGPSDLAVVFTESSDIHLVALDLAAQAEHGADSMVLGISPSAPALDALADELARIAADHQSLPDAVCVLVQTPDVRGAVALANAFAPEHLQLIGAEAEQLASLVDAAGCLFVGAASATAFGDYVAGSNHILPTTGAARFSSGLAARHFRRRMCEVHVGAGAEPLARAGVPLALAEGFKLHAESMQARAWTPASSTQAPATVSDGPLGQN
jgi:histidinol dehydrogenase